MKEELETLSRAARHGVYRELACPECMGVLGPRTVVIPMTCEHCRWVGALRDLVAVDPPAKVAR